MHKVRKISIPQYLTWQLMVLLANILSNNLVNDINESATIIKLTSMIPEVGNVKFANKIKGSLHGIADSEDVKKRQ
jgi:hypothetical protein